MNISERFIANAGATVEVLDDQTFNSSGTWTKPTGIQFAPTDMALVEMWGGGQGGARRNDSGVYAAGGFGGDYVRFVVPVSSLANTQPVVVGAGGAGGAGAAAAGASGGRGGDSSFAGCTATGGFLGGFYGSSAAQFHSLVAAHYTSRVYSAGAGGSVADGDRYPPVPSAVGGSGGAAAASTGAGAAGQAPGGGGGASTGSTGGAGAKGRVRVRIMRGLNQFEIAEGPL